MVVVVASGAARSVHRDRHRWGGAWSWSVAGGAGGTVVGTVVGAVGRMSSAPIVRAAGPVGRRPRPASRVADHGRGPPGAAGRPGQSLPGCGEAEASGSFWISSSGTDSRAPHSNRAAPGRLPFPILVLRTPRSSWDDRAAAVGTDPRACLHPWRDGSGRLLRAGPGNASDSRTPRPELQVSLDPRKQNDRLESGRQPRG